MKLTRKILIYLIEEKTKQIFFSACLIWLNLKELCSKKKSWVVSTQNVGSNMDKPKCWVKNVFKKCTVESEG